MIYIEVNEVNRAKKKLFESFPLLFLKSKDTKYWLLSTSTDGQEGAAASESDTTSSSL